MILQIVEMLKSEVRSRGHEPEQICLTPEVYQSLKEELSAFSDGPIESLDEISGLRVVVNTGVPYGMILVK